MRASAVRLLALDAKSAAAGYLGNGDDRPLVASDQANADGVVGFNSLGRPLVSLTDAIGNNHSQHRERWQFANGTGFDVPLIRKLAGWRRRKAVALPKSERAR